MPTKIRLQRKGKKRRPFYHLVAADGRAPRDGKFIEKLGTYDPVTTPAKIDLNFERCLYWIQVGAQPTDTARSLLSSKGVMIKHHLLKGVKKGALTEEQAEEKFQQWLKEREEKLQKITNESMLSEKEKQKKRIEEERKINEARAEILGKKREEEEAKAKDEAKSEEKGDDIAKEEEKKEEVSEAEDTKEVSKEETEKDAPKAEETKEDPKEKEKKEEASKAEETKEDPKEELEKDTPKSEEEAKEIKQENKEKNKSEDEKKDAE